MRKSFLNYLNLDGDHKGLKLDQILELLYDVAVLKYPFDPHKDACFPKMKLRAKIILFGNSPFEDDLLWFVYFWRLLTHEGYSSVLIMKKSSYKLMLKMFPEAEFVLRSTVGRKDPYYGWSDSVNTASTVNVFFLGPEVVSHIDRESYGPCKEVQIKDHGRFDRLEVYARLRYEGA